MNFIRKFAPTFNVDIFIAGDIAQAHQVCREWAMKGACVTVTPTEYIYTGGQESGVRIGLINYPRFPKSPNEILDEAEALALKLMERLCQTSFTIICGEKTIFYSRRREDLVPAAA